MKRGSRSITELFALFLAGQSLLACGYGSGLAGPSGQRVHLYVVDAETLLFQNKRMGWAEFRKVIRARVELAKQGKAAIPRVVVHTGRLRIDGFGDRILSLLQAAGVRSIDFPDG